MQANIGKNIARHHASVNVFLYFQNNNIFANAWENAEIIFLVNLGCTSISACTTQYFLKFFNFNCADTSLSSSLHITILLCFHEFLTSTIERKTRRR